MWCHSCTHVGIGSCVCTTSPSITRILVDRTQLGSRRLPTIIIRHWRVSTKMGEVAAWRHPWGSRRLPEEGRVGSSCLSSPMAFRILYAARTLLSAIGDSVKFYCLSNKPSTTAAREGTDTERMGDGTKTHWEFLIPAGCILCASGRRGAAICTLSGSPP